MDTLKIIELYSLNGWIIWSVNYISIKQLPKKVERGEIITIFLYYLVSWLALNNGIWGSNAVPVLGTIIKSLAASISAFQKLVAMESGWAYSTHWWQTACRERPHGKKPCEWVHLGHPSSSQTESWIVTQVTPGEITLSRRTFHATENDEKFKNPILY